jgi:integrase
LAPESLGNLMADWIEAAGLGRHCVLHGLRKACCRRLAEMGCGEKEIASVSGHTTLGEVARYTRAASQEKLADLALARIVARSP